MEQVVASVKQMTNLFQEKRCFFSRLRGCPCNLQQKMQKMWICPLLLEQLILHGSSLHPALFHSLPSLSGIRINSLIQYTHYLDLLQSTALGVCVPLLWENWEWIPALLFKLLVSSLVWSVQILKRQCSILVSMHFIPLGLTRTNQ